MSFSKNKKSDKEMHEIWKEIEIIMDNIPKNLKNAIEKANLTQEEVAELLKRYNSTISNYENGKIKNHRIVTLLAFCRIYECSLNDFLNDPTDLHEKRNDVFGYRQHLQLLQKEKTALEKAIENIDLCIEAIGHIQNKS